MKRFFPLLVIAILIPSLARAESLQIAGVSFDQEVWLGDPIGFECECNGTENVSVSGVNARITGPLNPPDISMDANGNKYQASWIPTREGKYSINLTCTGESPNGTVTAVSGPHESGVRMLGLGLLEMEPSSLFTDTDQLILHMNLTEISDSVLPVDDPNEVEWEVHLGQNPVDPDYVYDTDGRMWILTMDVPEIGPGVYTLDVRASYEGKNVSFQTETEIFEAMEFSILSVSPEKPLKGDEITVNLKSQYRDANILGDSSVRVWIGDMEITGFEKNTESLIFPLPDISAGSKELKVSLAYGGFPERTDTHLFDITVPVSGRITNADGLPVKGKLIFDKGTFSETLSLKNGEYSLRLPPGEYDLTIENMGDLRKLSFDDFDMYEHTSTFMRYDDIEDYVSMPRMRIASALAVEVYRYFLNALMEIKYDASKVGNEEDLHIYTCENWNFDGRVCSSGWKEITGRTDEGSNIVEISTDHFSAFIIAEEEGMMIEASINKEEYFMGEDIDLLGTVRTEGGTNIPDASVKIEMGADSRVLKTNSQGVFSAKLYAPMEIGEFDISLESNLSLTEKLEETLDFSTYAKDELSLLLPLEAEISSGEENHVTLTVLNSGQSDLNNLTVSVSGVPEEWLDYSPVSFSSLESGDSENIDIMINPAFPEKSVYTLTIDIGTDELERTETLEIGIINGTMEEKEEEHLPGLFTSNFISSTNDLLNIISMVAAFCVLLAALFAKRHSRSAKKDTRISSLIGNIRNEVLKKDKPKKRRRRR